MIDPQLPWSSDVDFQLICIADPRSIARSHRTVTWSAAVVTSFLLSNIPLIIGKILAIAPPIDRPPINPQLTWSSAVDCLLICINDPIYITPTDPVPRSPLYSAVDCQ